MKKPTAKGPTREALLRSIPFRNKLVTESTDIPAKEVSGMVLRLTAPIALKRWQSIFINQTRQGTGRYHKSYDLDTLGTFVWHAIDGKRTVEQLITHFATSHQANLRESELAVLGFLQTLTRRGLVALAVKHEKP